jgi:hypothetical protein
MNESARNRARRKRGISPDDVLTCPYCGKEFLRGDLHGSRKYCSEECSEKMYQQKRQEK